MTKKKQPTMEIKPTDGQITSETTLGINDPEIVEAEVINEEVGEEYHPNFIESNTQAITLEELTENNIIPTFADNSLTISHQNFIGAVRSAAEKVFGELTPVECRVSHPVHGRLASAQNKRTEDLTDSEKTLHYMRLAWVCHVKNITRSINGQTVHLCVGGCRAYNEDKLYARQSPMKFKIFVAWQAKICSNLMISCLGNSGTIECLTEADINQKAIELFEGFNPDKENTLKMLENLQTTRLSEELFCKIIGRLRLYQFLPVSEQKKIPALNIGDQAVNAMVKGYVSNPNFGKKEDEDITCWQLLQLANEAAKAAYIDRFIDRNQSCTDFALGIQRAIEGNDTEGYSWFLS